jgi:hypothetical protein
MHGGCQFGIFANWLFLKRLGVPIRGIVDEPRLKTRGPKEIKLDNVSTRPIVDREAPALISCEDPADFWWA